MATRAGRACRPSGGAHRSRPRRAGPAPDHRRARRSGPAYRGTPRGRAGRWPLRRSPARAPRRPGPVAAAGWPRRGARRTGSGSTSAPPEISSPCTPARTLGTVSAGPGGSSTAAPPACWMPSAYLAGNRSAGRSQAPRRPVRGKSSDRCAARASVGLVIGTVQMVRPAIPRARRHGVRGPARDRTAARRGPHQGPHAEHLDVDGSAWPNLRGEVGERDRLADAVPEPAGREPDRPPRVRSEPVHRREPTRAGSASTTARIRCVSPDSRAASNASRPSNPPGLSIAHAEGRGRPRPGSSRR